MSKQEFGRCLQQLLNDRNWSQADLTREVERATGKRMGRDAVSTYINGRSFPTPASLNQLCKAFGMSREELFPSVLMIARTEDHPAFEMCTSASQPGKAWVRLNQQVSFETALEIARLVSSEDSPSST